MQGLVLQATNVFVILYIGGSGSLIRRTSVFVACSLGFVQSLVLQATNVFVIL